MKRHSRSIKPYEVPFPADVTIVSHIFAQVWRYDMHISALCYTRVRAIMYSEIKSAIDFR